MSKYLQAGQVRFTSCRDVRCVKLETVVFLQQARFAQHVLFISSWFGVKFRFR